MKYNCLAIWIFLNFCCDRFGAWITKCSANNFHNKSACGELSELGNPPCTARWFFRNGVLMTSQSCCLTATHDVNKFDSSRMVLHMGTLRCGVRVLRRRAHDIGLVRLLALLTPQSILDFLAAHLHLQFEHAQTREKTDDSWHRRQR